MAAGGTWKSSSMAGVPDVDLAENRRRMARGELYYAFTEDLAEERVRCQAAVTRLNSAGDVSRREAVELWKAVTQDNTPLPPTAATPEEDAAQLRGYPYIDAPITKIDYGYNVRIGAGAYLNSGSTFIDTCLIEIGARTLIGPNCSFYSGTHPLDPFVRNGIRGPESGKPIKIGEDCWLGGNCIILPGVTIGRGSTVGAGSVVTKDVPEFVVVVGNPARILRKIEVSEPGKPGPEGTNVLAGEATPSAGSDVTAGASAS